MILPPPKGTNDGHYNQSLLTKSRNYHALEMEAQPHNTVSHKISTLWHRLRKIS